MHTYIHTYIHTYMPYVYPTAWASIDRYIYTHSRTHTHTPLSTHIHTYTYTRIHTHVHTHTHTLPPSNPRSKYSHTCRQKYSCAPRSCAHAGAFNGKRNQHIWKVTQMYEKEIYRKKHREKRSMRRSLLMYVRNRGARAAHAHTLAHSIVDDA